MKQVFDDLVGFKPVTTAKVYVNDLPGISEELALALVEEEDSNGDNGLAGLWARVVNNAMPKLLIDLETTLSEKGAFRQELAYTDPLPFGAQELAAGTGSSYQLETIAMRHTVLRAKQIGLLFASAGTATVELLSAGYTKSILVEAEGAGLVYVQLDEALDLPNDRGINLTVTVTADVPLLSFGGTLQSKSHNDCATALCLYRQQDQERINVEEAFLEILWSLDGDLPSLVERNKHTLMYAFQYLCGKILLHEKLSSNQFNVFTNTNRLTTEDNLEAYGKSYKSFLLKAASLIAQQLRNTYILEATPEETGGWHTASII